MMANTGKVSTPDLIPVHHENMAEQELTAADLKKEIKGKSKFIEVDETADNGN